MIWFNWFYIIWQLKPAFSNIKTFCWAIIVCASFSIRTDNEGVTSFIRAHMIMPKYYQCLLDFFHSKAIDLEKLTILWTKLVIKIFKPFLKIYNQRIILLGDGLVVTKEGKKMPAVKSLHQSSSNNSKAQYVRGHYFQLISLLAGSAGILFSVPLICQIHQGLKLSPNHKQTIIDKLLIMLKQLAISNLFYFVGDAYYACAKMAQNIKDMSGDIITRVRHNAVAYYSAAITNNKVGRPKLYGKKVKIKELFSSLTFTKILSPVYGETGINIKYVAINLLWRPLGKLVQFVLVDHPNRGRIILMTTDLQLPAIEVIKIYSQRFKIEVAIKVALYRFGTFCYHFWLKSMKKLKKFPKDQYLHKATTKYKEKVLNKVQTYHVHVQLGCIAQGLVQYLALAHSVQIWKLFGSWLRTIRNEIIPTENIVRMALQNSFLEFLLSRHREPTFEKFLKKHIDFDRINKFRMTG